MTLPTIILCVCLVVAIVLALGWRKTALLSLDAADRWERVAMQEREAHQRTIEVNEWVIESKEKTIRALQMQARSVRVEAP